MKLAETQQLLWQLISAPAGAAPGLRQLNMTERDLAALICGDDRLPPLARLDIYANMYFFRLRDILAGDFSSLAASVGGAAFHNLVTDYLHACPSRHQSVRNVGARLPEFLRTHALTAEQPWLPDLARLEWARIEAFDGPDAEPLTVEQLRATAPDGFAALPLRLIPCHQLLDVGFAVEELWRQVESGALGEEEAPEPPAAEPRSLLVWRQDVDVYHRPVDALEREALSRVQQGAPFGVICELVAERVPPEEAAARAFALLANWAGDGLLRTS